MMQTVVLRMANARFIGRYAVNDTSTITISILVSRATTVNNRVELIVTPNGTAGTDLMSHKPMVARAAAAPGQFQDLVIQYSVVNSGWIDVHLSHTGVAGAIMRYDSLRVVEQ